MDSNSVEATKTVGTAIVSIDDAMKRMLSSGLNMNGLIALLCDDCKLPKKQVKLVLTSLQNLKGNYCDDPIQRKFRNNE